MKYIFLLALLISLISCDSTKPDSKNGLTQFEWMEGEWMDSTSDGKMVEIWNRINDSTFVGSSIYMAGIDTIFYEEISLRMKNEKIFYVPSIQNQNNGEAVYFAFTGALKGEFTFENQEHDFPKKIVYTNPHKDSLVAFIEGPTASGYKKEFFRMRRVK
jgi:hypothetical protein